MAEPLRVLIVDDMEDEALLVVEELRRGGFEPEWRRVDNGPALEAALDANDWDLILCDYVMPHLTPFEALDAVRRRGLDPPLIAMTGRVDEGFMLELMQAGAHDIILKDKPARLLPAVRRELRQAAVRREKRRAEAQLEKSYAILKAVFDGSGIGIALIDQEGLITQSNSALQAMLGYTGAELDRTPAKAILHPAEVATCEGLFQDLKEGKLQRHQKELRYLHQDGRVIWGQLTISLISDPQGGFRFCAAMIQDITPRKEAEAKVAQGVENLRLALAGTVRAVAAICELRDPYTAGHQERVTRLACALAAALGLTGDQIEGLRVAGLLHDIGKISVPAEILNKPGRLSELEYNLIKLHPQAAYDILRHMEFPWPVAQIVHQHHESLNGSGYPQGLKGEEIMLEARILRVADTVEAMAAHRPYRAARGLVAALEEIAQNKGIIYDEAVVETCLRLFRDKVFIF